MKIAIAGTGYVGLSMAVLLSQRNKATALGIVPTKVGMINQRISPIHDVDLQNYLNNKQLNCMPRWTRTRLTKGPTSSSSQPLPTTTRIGISSTPAR